MNELPAKSGSSFIYRTVFVQSWRRRRRRYEEICL